MAFLSICLPIRESVYPLGPCSVFIKWVPPCHCWLNSLTPLRLRHRISPGIKGFLPALQAGAPQVQGCIEHPSAHKTLGSSQLSVHFFLGPCSTSHLVLFLPKELAITQPGLFGGVCCFVFLVSKKFTYKLIFKRVSFLAFTPPFFLSIVLRLSLGEFSVLHCQAVRMKMGPHLTH